MDSFFFSDFLNPDEEEAQAICTFRITWTTAVSLTSVMNILFSSVICHLFLFAVFIFYYYILAPLGLILLLVIGV